jgi:cytosol alanyl aminopeptidase
MSSPRGPSRSCAAQATDRAGARLPAAACEEKSVPLGRLPADVRPTYHELSVEVQPQLETFSGQIRIEVRLEAPRDVIWLHALGLEVHELSVVPAGGQRVGARFEMAHPDGIAALRLDKPIGPGAASLRLQFSAPFDVQLDGLYRVQAGGRSYAFTQFQSIAARKAFPCFDEPAFKAPWDLTLVVRRQDEAIANTREVGREQRQDGLWCVRFATTPPLPSYLLAWAVGPLDLVEAPPIPASPLRPAPVPLRGAAARGRGAELAYALAQAPAQLAALEDYFGIAYPYDKLDLVAVPDFATGAMENAGVITFREAFLLLEEASAPEGQKRILIDVLAHELAHQWFGNLVTMSWWDDLWLNEAFAEWMGKRVVHSLYPQYRFELSSLESVHGAMREDSLRSARQIRQPVETNHDIENAFDEITYQKGLALLSMMEHWLGEEVFRQGVRLHVGRHEHSTATAADLLSAVSEAAGRDVSAAFETFLLQPGVPLLRVGSGNDAGPPHLRLQQGRFLPVGSEARAGRLWQIPVCVRYGDRSQSYESSTLLGAAEGRLELDLSGPPAWILPNAAGAGYYRWALPPEDLERLLRDGWEHLGGRERLTVADSLEAAFEAASLPVGHVLDALPRLASDEHRAVAVAPMRLLRFLCEHAADAELRPRLERFCRELYRPRLEQLGWEALPSGDEPETRLLREAVMGFLADIGADPEVAAEAAQRGRDYLGIGSGGALQPAAVLPELAGLSVAAAIRADGAPTFDTALEHLFHSEVAILRARLLAALAATRDPKLCARVHALVLDPRLRVNELLLPLHRQMAQPQTRELTWQWFRASHDAVAERVGQLVAGSLPDLARYFCSAAAAREAREHFEPRVEKTLGGPRNLANALESIALREARLRAAAPGVREYFGGRLP